MPSANLKRVSGGQRMEERQIRAQPEAKLKGLIVAGFGVRLSIMPSA